jgi:hypothetical protein
VLAQAPTLREAYLNALNKMLGKIPGRQEKASSESSNAGQPVTV